jgi:hypothetical protein
MSVFLCMPPFKQKSQQLFCWQVSLGYCIFLEIVLNYNLKRLLALIAARPSPALTAGFALLMGSLICNVP